MKPNPPLAPLALNVPYGPLTGPPCPKGTSLSASTRAAGCGFCCVGAGLGLRLDLGGSCPGSESRPALSPSGLGCDCVSPLESLARTFCVLYRIGRQRDCCSPASRPWHRRRRPRPSLRHCCWARSRRRAQCSPRIATCSPSDQAEVAAPAVVFEENLSVCCHARPAVE